jgi:hypothetical protein
VIPGKFCWGFSEAVGCRQMQDAASIRFRLSGTVSLTIELVMSSPGPAREDLLIQDGE